MATRRQIVPAAKPRWRVQKLDGVWQAFDEDGNLRYASTDWQTVVCFALLGLGPMKPRNQDPFRGLFK